MRVATIALPSFALAALAGAALASCTIETGPRGDQFDYTRNEDGFLGITTSTATARFPMEDVPGALFLVAKCVHNVSHPENNELTLTASSVGSNSSGTGPSLDAMIYKLDQAEPVVYRDPQPAFDPASEFPATSAGSWQQSAANGAETLRLPASNSQDVYVNLQQLLSGLPKSPQTIALRFVHGGSGSGQFGSGTVQEYAQYSFKDVSIAVNGTNFGRILTDCRKGG